MFDLEFLKSLKLINRVPVTFESLKIVSSKAKFDDNNTEKNKGYTDNKEINIENNKTETYINDNINNNDNIKDNNNIYINDNINVNDNINDNFDISKFQEICDFFGLPLYEPEIANNFDTLLVFLTNLSIEYKNYDILLPDTAEFKRKNILMEQLKEIERDSDRLEVKITNLNKIVSKTSYEYYNMINNELTMIKKQNKSIELVKEFQLYLKNLINKLEEIDKFNSENNNIYNNEPYNNHNNEPYNIHTYNNNFDDNKLFSEILFSNLDKRIYFLKSYKKYKNYILKDKILRNIAVNTTPEGIIVNFLINNRFCDANYLQDLCKVDRVEFLKIIYKLSYKGIIDYNADKNTVSLNFVR
ncbi:hypothetical protein DMUE_4741 [Dictyocoela muelleri]|nr:hypothetical protein DMUE_4741 [Dictyocoela muelleri]